MKSVLVCIIIVTAEACGAFAQATKPSVTPVPEGFTSDGCSLFPEGDYHDCCVQHDLVYFSGGSWKSRWRADDQFRRCVGDKKGFVHKPLSLMMWIGVRIGGVPWLSTPFRWGFGKSSLGQ
ncbi:MAG: hypothetical protein ABI878_12610 [Acidobacteriota bacterium]